jgi:ADP-ribose pyrophosphatase
MSTPAEPSATLLSQTTAYTGRVFAVTADRVRLPHGRETTLDIVRHRGSVVMIPLPDPEHVILIRQYRYALDRWIWELPAGSLDPGESPEPAAARECEEEIGLVPATIEFLGAWYPSPGFVTEVMNFYKLTGLRPPNPEGPQAHKDEDEDIRTQVFTLAAARDLVRRGEVVDLKTAWGLTLV